MVFTLVDLRFVLAHVVESPKKNQAFLLSSFHAGSLGGVPLAVAGPVLGAPAAVMVLEKLIALGVRQVLALGWCGSISEQVRIADVVVPTAALSEEGASAHYPLESPPEEMALPSRRLVEPPGSMTGGLISFLQPKIPNLHAGPVWTTDAPYRETRGKVIQYAADGILGVEMETSALFTVARYRNIDFAAALAVSDSLASLEWRPGSRLPGFTEARELLAREATGYLCQRKEGGE